MAGRQDIEAGKAFVRLFLKDDMTRNLQRSLNNVGQTLKATGASVARVGAGVAAAGTAILAPITLGMKEFLSFGDTLDKMRQRTGISVEALSELSHAAGQSGSSIEDVEKEVE